MRSHCACALVYVAQVLARNRCRSRSRACCARGPWCCRGTCACRPECRPGPCVISTIIIMITSDTVILINIISITFPTITIIIIMIVITIYSQRNGGHSDGHHRRQIWKHVPMRKALSSSFVIIATSFGIMVVMAASISRSSECAKQRERESIAHCASEHASKLAVDGARQKARSFCESK